MTIQHGVLWVEAEHSGGGRIGEAHVSCQHLTCEPGARLALSVAMGARTTSFRKLPAARPPPDPRRELYF